MVEEKESFETLAKINEAFADNKGRPLKTSGNIIILMIPVWLSPSELVNQSFNVSEVKLQINLTPFFKH
jgi:hypothetical protein